MIIDNPLQLDKFTLFGKIMHLHTFSEEYVSEIKIRRIWYSCSFLQATIIKNEYQESIGYLCWGMFSKETVVTLKHYKTWPVYIYEWNEGNFLTLVDIFILHQYRKKHINQIMKAIKTIKTKKSTKFFIPDRNSISG